MTLNWIDWLVIVAYFVLSLGVGILFSRRAGKSIQEFFVSGRSFPWWIAGTSMVATTFAADTPLAVTGLVAKYGLAGNWFWWAMAVGGMLTVFLFARLWRRAEVLTDVELIELRYGGRPAAFLRGFRAFYLAIPVNTIIIGWVNFAMLKVLKVTLFGEEANDWLLLGVMVAITAIYSMLSGLWGVAVTDVIQFVLAMGGCITLAVLAVQDVGGISALQQKVVAAYPEGEQVLRFLPDFSQVAWISWKMFLVYLFILWWASWYPGAEPGGGGYIVQRMASCKDEKHALLATLWFQIAHYCLRPWPWLIVAFVALVKYPELRTLSDPGEGFPRVMRDLLPPGLRGWLLTAFFAAYMSTLSTQVNWGASYLVNDLYKRFIKRDAPDKHYAWMSRVASLVIVVLAAAVTPLITSVESAWKFLAALGAGTGAVFILRWFWWRINAWTEISAMVASLGFFLLAQAIASAKDRFGRLGQILSVPEYQTAFVACATIGVWLVVTFLTRPESQSVLTSFYRKIRPANYGWRPIASQAPDVVPDNEAFVPSLLSALFGIITVYSVLPGVGYAIFGSYGKAALCFVIAAGGVSGIVLMLNRIGWERIGR